MLTPTEACLESKCQRIARILTKQYGVQVRIEGSVAYFDMQGRVIVLPNLLEASWDTVDGLIDGFLDHECGHALFTEYKKAKRLDGKLEHFFWNGVEDSWTEREMIALYPGCKDNLDAVKQILDEKIFDNWEKLDFLNRLNFVLVRTWERVPMHACVDEDVQITLSLEHLEKEVADGFKVASTAEAVKLAKRIVEKLEQVNEQQEECESPSQAQDDQDTEAGEASDPGDESESEDEAIHEGEGEIPDVSAQDVPVQVTDMENFFNAQLESVPIKPNVGPEEYVVFSEQYDHDTTYSSDVRMDKSMKYAQLKEEVAEYIGSMATTLELCLTIDTETRWAGGSRKGRKFDKRRLGQWFLDGDDDRIWKTKEQKDEWDTAVSLLWDCSGSMEKNVKKDGKSYLARLAAIAFHEALSRAHIPHEVLGFNTGAACPVGLARLVKQARDRGENLQQFSRLDAVDKRMVFVEFGQTDGRALCLIDGNHTNRDAECVLWAAKRLAARPEKRKLLIVGSDGHPSGGRYGYTEKKYLQQVVRQVINSGIELQAIGIMDNSVKQYYPNWMLIEKATDIPAVVIHQLAKNLLKRGTSYDRFPEVFRRSGGESRQ